MKIATVTDHTLNDHDLEMVAAGLLKVTPPYFLAEPFPVFVDRRLPPIRPLGGSTTPVLPPPTTSGGSGLESLPPPQSH